jgi:pimeloyl-ACP methyl ester carboxylesterase
MYDQAPIDGEMGEYFDDLYYLRSGEGPPIITLHGLGGTSFSWRYLSPLLRAQNTIYSFDLRGHGKSRSCASRELFSISAQAHSICRFIRENNLRETVLVGNSLGGGIALLTALLLLEDRERRLDSLILLDSIGFTQKLPFFFRVLRSFPYLVRGITTVLPHTWVIRQVLNRAFFDKTKISCAAVDAYAKNLARPNGINELIATAKQMIPDRVDELMALFQDIELPTLLIWGKQDKFVPPYVGIGLNALLHNSQLVFVENCGHLPQEEQPEITGQKIIKFLDERNRKPPNE